MKKILTAVLLVLISYIWIGSNIGSNDKVLTTISSAIPERLSQFIKENIFIFHYKKQQGKKINDLNQLVLNQNNELEFKNKQLQANSFLIENELRSKKKKIIFNKINTQYDDKFIKYRTTNIISGVVAEGGGTSYIQEYEKIIYLVSSKGIISFINQNNFTAESLDFTTIPSNIVKIIGYEEFFYKWGAGIKSFLIKDGKIYISFTDMPKLNCYNTSIIVADLNNIYLNFTDFFRKKECVKEKNIYGEFARIQGGGKIEDFKNNEILFSIGTYRFRDLAQDKKSIFGKIISINLDTKNHKIISMGHRNVQGLYYDKVKNMLYISEHGPKGGDEINFLDLNEKLHNQTPNFGWPISSYGYHYGKPESEKIKSKYKKAPLLKSHKSHGFIEPIKYYNSAIAPSKILKISNDSGSKILLGSMLKEAIFDLTLKNDNIIMAEEIIFFGERVRDFILLKDTMRLLVFLENTASLAIINLR